jgi:hypothetical protein
MVTLAVVGIITGFLLLDLGIQYLGKRARAKASVCAIRPTAAQWNPAKPISDFLMPLGFFFRPGHTWIRIHDRGTVTAGFVLAGIIARNFPVFSKEVPKRADSEEDLDGYVRMGWSV